MGKYSETPQNPNSEVEEEEEVVVDVWSKKKMKRSQVFLEGYVEAPPPPPTGFTNASTEDEDEDPSRGVSRTVSLTDDDLDELKGCLDLGFGFNYEEIPELCNTLPALELCYSMSHRFLDDQQQQQSGDTSSVVSSSATSLGSNPPPPHPPPIANWKISSPGDRPEEVKARLKFWAQAVACTVKLCN